jgi:2-iminobutanoate/2-iminopropanoate deaminase
MTRHAITTDKIAPSGGPFSPAVELDGSNLYLSGQVGQDPASGQLVHGGVVQQTEQILRNAGAVLEAAGRSYSDVLRVGVFLTDIRDFDAMNAVYVKFFDQPYPARTTVGVAGLPLGAGVEMDFVVR